MSKKDGKKKPAQEPDKPKNREVLPALAHEQAVEIVEGVARHIRMEMSFWGGPFPAPDKLGEYEDKFPGFAGELMVEYKKTNQTMRFCAEYDKRTNRHGLYVTGFVVLGAFALSLLIDTPVGWIVSAIAAGLAVINTLLRVLLGRDKGESSGKKETSGE